MTGVESPDTAVFQHSLTTLPAGAITSRVSADPVEIDGRGALRVSLLPEIAEHGVPGVDYVDQPTFLVLPVEVTDAVVEVDVRSRLTPTAPDYSRAFAGIAYRISSDLDRFEAAYLRPLNGRKVDPPAPRHLRAVQHFSYPEWPFDRLRENYPEGVFETGADIGPDEWTHLRVAFSGTRCDIAVNGEHLLTVTSLTAPSTGAVGLFVDIGTEAFFSNLVITPVV